MPSTLRSRALRAWGWKPIANPGPDGPRTIWTKAREDALEPIALHEGRHTAASEMRAAGLDFKVISQIIGHASVTITQDRYTHVDRQHLPVAAEQFGAHIEAVG